MILGVCKGLAEYFGVQVKWVRIAAVIALVATGFWPALAVYLLAAYFIRPEPRLALETELEEEFYSSYTRSRAMALSRLKQEFDSLDRRIQRMEGAVTAREFQWQQRLDGNSP
jgi:phage shock protein C